MIERLNFYDVYGYLFPGVVLLTLLWLPAALMGITSPFGDAVALALSIVVGYVSGHLIQLVASGAFPSKIKGRYPSDRFLDDDDDSLPLAVKSKVRRLVQEQFEIDITTRDGERGESLASRRETAFRMCRTAVHNKTARTYAEQYQAMYVFMRGVCTATILGAMFYLGCVGGVVAPSCLRNGMRLVAATTIIATVVLALSSSLGPHAPTGVQRFLERADKSWTFARVMFCLLALDFFGVGWVAAVPRIHLSRSMVAPLLLAVATAVFLVSYFLQEYRKFASLFASTIYRDFAGIPVKAADQNTPGS